MQHTNTCDDCGSSFFTYCFGEGGGKLVFEPPMPDRPMTSQEYDREFFKRERTHLCNECIEKRARGN